MRYVIRFSFEVEGKFGDKVFWLEDLKHEDKQIVRTKNIEDARSFDDKLEAIQLKKEIEQLLSDKFTVRVESVSENVGQQKTEIIVP